MQSRQGVTPVYCFELQSKALSVSLCRHHLGLHRFRLAANPGSPSLTVTALAA